MGPMRIGLLHPGEMGAAVGEVLVAAGHLVGWASEGRSAATVRRAAAAGLQDRGSLAALCQASSVILSICPPHGALALAREVSGFQGIYVDANAVAPATARAVASVIVAGGGRYVDGGIIGGPPVPGRPTRLCLSGDQAAELASLFSGTPVQPLVLTDDPTAASALKMCYAAWTKGSMALLLGVRALARAQGVESELVDEWEHSLPQLRGRCLTAAHQAATKGWRWVGEMHELATTFADAGLPEGFAAAAADLYGRPDRSFEALADGATLDYVLGALLRPEDRRP